MSTRGVHLSSRFSSPRETRDGVLPRRLLRSTIDDDRARARARSRSGKCLLRFLSTATFDQTSPNTTCTANVAVFGSSRGTFLVTFFGGKKKRNRSEAAENSAGIGGKVLKDFRDSIGLLLMSLNPFYNHSVTLPSSLPPRLPSRRGASEDDANGGADCAGRDLFYSVK